MTPEQQQKAYQRRAMRRRIAMLVTAAASYPAFRLMDALLPAEMKAALAGQKLMILGLALGVLVYMGVMALLTRWMLPLSDEERAA
jgi:hypothetical protein